MSGKPPLEGSRPKRRGRRLRVRNAAYLALAVFVLIAAFFTFLAWELLDGVTGGGAEQAAGGNGADRRAREVARVEPPRPVHVPDEPFNILLLGTDAGLRPDGTLGARRTDTMMLASIDLLTRRLSVLSIPRDTLARIPLDRLDQRLHEYVTENPTKITHAHAYAGPSASIAAVEELLKVPVHRYARVNLDGFVNLIDIVGGVELCVAKDMDYDDDAQDLHIHLQKGCQHLNGAEAVQYARYRQDGDIARIDRQQKLIRAVIEQSLQLGIVPRLPRLVDEITAQVDTNLSKAEILKFVGVATRYASEYEPGKVTMATVPGRSGWLTRTYNGQETRVSYWLPDEQGTRELVDALVWRLTSPAETLGILVKNASGSQEAGREVAEYLQDHGYRVLDVVDQRPAGATEVIMHRDDQVEAKVVARAIARQVETARVYEQLDGESAVDLTIVVGRDYLRNQH